MNIIIYKAILKKGNSKKVAKEFKELYPEIIEQSNFGSYDNIMFIHMSSSKGIASAIQQNQERKVILLKEEVCVNIKQYKNTNKNCI